MKNYKYLYNSGVVVSPILRDAHPYGGAEVVEVVSGEGMVEDLVESQLKILDMVAKQPTLEVLATLADKLDHSSLFSVADSVEAIMRSFAASAKATEAIIRKASADIKDALHYVDELRNIVEFGYSDVSPHKYSLLAVLNNIGKKLHEDEVDWKTVRMLALSLLDDSVLYGRLDRVLEVDLDSQLSKTGFQNWVHYLMEIINIAESSIDESQVKTTRKPIIKSDPIVENLIRKVQDIDSRIDVLSDNGESIKKIRPELSYDIDSMFSDPEVILPLREFREVILPNIADLRGSNPSQNTILSWKDKIDNTNSAITRLEEDFRSLTLLSKKVMVLPE